MLELDPVRVVLGHGLLSSSQLSPVTAAEDMAKLQKGPPGTYLFEAATVLLYRTKKWSTLKA
ncbi:hypothetical protein MTX26_27005 [Bradyrhizobium sp. ISRA443]|uniref:hypothetical protein n=1 Tax=unclassified Bradyrhizobium TaxID=2631580 RepID=UPI00247A8DEC|nr:MULTISPECIES: hypothetical protein [unclassified Bradyrhizobium]WGR93407.1 hypothetical protein MTX20_01800 [Bradyrhizobium sp. ISRA435]WGR97949.1 hypothetical protein MTX23_27000 [Bradyrhizobium sp. ISRA436]WGS04839.1 hypothetical protein MTX18_27010 [Bradyrhizobium sp. ISRA437]WGS11720.1 hypothetical protein MTX26_27005 [Bradyrhizobium sp. ISRA443]